MSQTHPTNRRTFLGQLAGLGAAALASGCTGASRAAGSGVGNAASALRDKIGLQLYTVRDQFLLDLPGTLQRVARLGYSEVQTTITYADYTPKQIKEFLDATGLKAPTTHVSPRVGPEFERTLEGHQLIGHRYTTVAFGTAPAQGGRMTPEQRAGMAAAAVAGTRYPLPASMTQPQRLDSVRRTAEQLNEAGRITQRYGIKVMVHNHTNEFRPLADSSRTEYDVLLAETDADLVAMELDIGWAVAAGQNPLEMFRQSPGRYEVWHVKDLSDLAALHAIADKVERMAAARIVSVGEGEIDYQAIFAQAALAGMKHFYVEQDSAPQSGDSIAAAGQSYRGLLRILS